jgi:hypothetical protein
MPVSHLARREGLQRRERHKLLGPRRQSGIDSDEGVSLQPGDRKVLRVARRHLGARRLRDLTASDVDKWLADRAVVLSSSTLQKLHSALNRAVKRAMARDKVKRNVVELCGVSSSPC